MNLLFYICLSIWIGIGAFEIGKRIGKEQISKEANDKIATALGLEVKNGK